jgi:hypothetical protein
VTVASGGRSSDAHLVARPDRTWSPQDHTTVFWVARTAEPPPADGGQDECVKGRERLTITAYDAAGQVLDTVTGGRRTAMPLRDMTHDSPGWDASPDPNPHPSPTPDPCGFDRGDGMVSVEKAAGR